MEKANFERLSRVLHHEIANLSHGLELQIFKLQKYLEKNEIWDDPKFKLIFKDITEHLELVNKSALWSNIVFGDFKEDKDSYMNFSNQLKKWVSIYKNETNANCKEIYIDIFNGECRKPIIKCDSKLVDLTIQNLFSNSIKYQQFPVNAKMMIS